VGSESSTDRLDEPVYQCPLCKSGPRQKGQWATRSGIMTCGICLNQGFVIMPERVEGVTEFNRCQKCGGQMAHYRLKGYRCPRCD
jgi:hypothetical protein